MLQNLPVSTKLVAILAIPVLVMLLLVVSRVATNVGDGRRADRLASVTGMETRAFHLIHKLQKERDLSAAYEELTEVNQRLANPPVIDMTLARRLGLFVVGRLAQRYSIQVRLRHSWYGGVTALVLMPEALLVRPAGVQAGQAQVVAAEGGRGGQLLLASAAPPAESNGNGAAVVPPAELFTGSVAKPYIPLRRHATYPAYGASLPLARRTMPPPGRRPTEVTPVEVTPEPAPAVPPASDSPVVAPTGPVSGPVAPTNGVGGTGLPADGPGGLPRRRRPASARGAGSPTDPSVPVVVPNGTPAEAPAPGPEAPAHLRNGAPVNVPAPGPEAPAPVAGTPLSRLQALRDAEGTLPEAPAPEAPRDGAPAVPPTDTPVGRLRALKDVPGEGPEAGGTQRNGHPAGQARVEPAADDTPVGRLRALRDAPDEELAPSAPSAPAPSEGLAGTPAGPVQGNGTGAGNLPAAGSPPADEPGGVSRRRRVPAAAGGPGAPADGGRVGAPPADLQHDHTHGLTGEEAGGSVTSSGLPRRVPRANMAPAWAAGPGAPAPPGAISRSPDEVRDMLSSYRTGIERGRHESAEGSGDQDDAPEDSERT